MASLPLGASNLDIRPETKGSQAKTQRRDTDGEGALYDATINQSGSPSERGDFVDGWHKLGKTLSDYDEVRIRDCKEDMDTLLVFAGLFSAVLTAFNIEAYKFLQQDSSVPIASILYLISQQLNTSTPPDSLHPPSPPSFKPSTQSVQINILWFASLVLSLVTASVAMLIKQWLREYTSQENLSSRSRIRIRFWRNQGLLRYRVFEVAAFLPVLLQIALMLFFGGLVVFLISLHRLVGWVVASMIIVWLLLYVGTTLSPIWSSQSPFKTPLLRDRVVFLRSFFRGGWHWIRNGRRAFHRIAKDDDKSLRVDKQLDIPSLIAADRTFIDEDFLDSTLRHCLSEAGGWEVVSFIENIIFHRCGRQLDGLQDVRADDLQRLTTRARLTSVNISIDILERELGKSFLQNRRMDWFPWMGLALKFVGTALLPVYPATGRGDQLQVIQRAGQLLVRLLAHHELVAQQVLEILCSSSYPRLPNSYSIPQITSVSVLQNAITGATVCVEGGKGDPVQMCQVIAYLALNSQEEVLDACQEALGQFFSSLPPKLEKMLREVVRHEPGLRAYAAALGLDYVQRLHMKRTNVMNEKVLDILRTLSLGFVNVQHS